MNDHYEGHPCVGRNVLEGPGLMTVDLNGRYQRERWRASSVKTDFEYYNHFQPRQTLAAHLGWETIVNPGPADQILLGGDTGPRGYRLKDEWAVHERTMYLPGHAERSFAAFSGLYFTAIPARHSHPV